MPAIPSPVRRSAACWKGAATPRPARKQNSDICGVCSFMTSLKFRLVLCCGPVRPPLQQAAWRRLKRWTPDRMSGEPYWAMDGPYAACHLFRCRSAGTLSLGEGPMGRASRTGPQQRTTPQSPIQPNPTQPNPTQPNPTQPNPKKPKKSPATKDGVEAPSVAARKSIAPDWQGRCAASYSRIVRISPSRSLRRLVNRAAAAPLITR